MRHLTRCGVCRNHIQLGTSIDDCPHCHREQASAGRLHLGSTGRAGLVAAALMAFSATACGGAESSGDDPGADTAGSDTGGEGYADDDSGAEDGDDEAYTEGDSEGGGSSEGDPGEDDTAPPPEPERGTVHALYGVPPG